MNEGTAALLGSIATAVLGVLGIMITQWVTLRVARIKAGEEEEVLRKVAQPELPFEPHAGAGVGIGLTGITMIRMDVESLKLMLGKGQQDIMKTLLGLDTRVRDLKDFVESDGMPPVL